MGGGFLRATLWNKVHWCARQRPHCNPRRPTPDTPPIDYADDEDDNDDDDALILARTGICSYISSASLMPRLPSIPDTDMLLPVSAFL